MRLPETAWRWPRVVAPVPAPHISASRGRFRRAVEQQELGHSFVDKELEQNFGEEASPAARRDESGPMTLFGTATASRRGPTGGLGAAAPVRAASGARAPAYNLPTWQLRRRLSHCVCTHTHTQGRDGRKKKEPRRKILFSHNTTRTEHLEHLECSHQPHAQDRGAKKRPS